MKKNKFDCIPYLNDTLKILIERAMKIKEDNPFNEGVKVGYAHAIDTLLEQAETFGIKDELDDYLRKFDYVMIFDKDFKGPFDDIKKSK